MININRGEVNRVFLTLNEKIVFTGGTFTMTLVSNEDVNIVKAMPLNIDLSLNEDRYNLYDITENVNEDLNNQIISLENSSYDYRVYNNSGSTLEDSSVIIESGLVLVDFKNDIYISGSTYQPTNNNDDITFI